MGEEGRLSDPSPISESRLVGDEARGVSITEGAREPGWLSVALARPLRYSRYGSRKIPVVAFVISVAVPISDEPVAVTGSQRWISMVIVFDS